MLVVAATKPPARRWSDEPAPFLLELEYRMRMIRSGLLPLALRIAVPRRSGNADRSLRRTGSALPLGAALTCAALALGFAADGAAQVGPQSRYLLVQVRDTPPEARPNFVHGRDRSYTVSTGSGADRDERGDAAAGNATVVSTSNSVRVVRVREGESVRVDLPSIQTLQFHVPPGKGAGSSGAGAAAGGGSTKAPVGGTGSAVSAVVYFEAVSAFAARFALAGGNVRIELVPLRTAGVAAPLVAGTAGETPRAVTLFGHIGEWIALGDVDLVSTGKSLSVTAEPPSQPSIWVRVEPAATAGP